MCSTDQMPTSDEKAATDEKTVNHEKPVNHEQPVSDDKPATDRMPLTDERPVANEEPASDEKPATHEKPPTDELQPPLPQAIRKNGRSLSRRRWKGTLLPQISQLALEGHSSRVIGAQLGIGKTTINRWLNELRLERRSNLVDATGMIANAVARYDLIYREAMEAWRTSKTDKEVRLIEDTEAAGNGGGSKKKRSVRTERRPGEIAFLNQARDAADSICKLVMLKGGPVTWDTVRPGDIRNMCEAEKCQVVDMVKENVDRLADEIEQLGEAARE